MMNYFPDLHFNDNRPSIQAHTLHVHSYAAHSHRCADDSFVQNCIKSLSQKEGKRKIRKGLKESGFSKRKSLIGGGLEAR